MVVLVNTISSANVTSRSKNWLTNLAGQILLPGTEHQLPRPEHQKTRPLNNFQLRRPLAGHGLLLALRVSVRPLKAALLPLRAIRLAAVAVNAIQRYITLSILASLASEQGLERKPLSILASEQGLEQTPLPIFARIGQSLTTSLHGAQVAEVELGLLAVEWSRLSSRVFIKRLKGGSNV